jgi:hypothetical protein
MSIQLTGGLPILLRNKPDTISTIYMSMRLTAAKFSHELLADLRVGVPADDGNFGTATLKGFDRKRLRIGQDWKNLFAH